MRKSTHSPSLKAAFLSALLALMSVTPLPGAAQVVRDGSSSVVRTSQSAARDLVVIVDGLRNDHGSVIGGLYADASHWLAENEAAENCHAPIHAGRARCAFHAASVSSVAFAALHDEDGDGRLDRDFVGIPTEGYAFSNDAREPFGPPSFEAASFSPTATRPLVVHVRYGI